MTPHLSDDQFGGYLARTLPPRQLLALYDHLESCPDCREALAERTLAREAGSVSPLWAESGEWHLTEDEMVQFAARRMAPALRPRAVGHLKNCPECRDSVAAMESVRGAAMERRRPMPTWIATAGSAAAILLVSTLLYFRAAEMRRPSPPAVVASLRDAGGTVALGADGALRGLPGASPAEQALVRETLRRQALPAGPAVVKSSSGTLRTPGDVPKAGFSLIGPVDSEVLSDRPEFSWQPGRGVTGYEVVVTNEALDPLARSGKITATRWQPAAALPRGVSLLWQVRALKGDETLIVPSPPAPPARFRIVRADVANRIEQLRASDHPSHLLIAALCAQAGLQDEERQELAALDRENPGSAIVERLDENRQAPK